MAASDVLPLVAQFGLAGVLMAYLFWKERNDREDRKRREDRQALIDERDVDAREKLAASIATLSEIIRAKFNV